MKTATLTSMTLFFPLTLVNAIPALLDRQTAVAICCNSCTDMSNCEATYCGIDRAFDFFVNWCLGVECGDHGFPSTLVCDPHFSEPDNGSSC